MRHSLSRLLAMTFAALPLLCRAMKDTLKALADLHLIPRDLNCGGSLCEGSFTSLNRKAGPVYITATKSAAPQVQSMTTTAHAVPLKSSACPISKVVKIDAVLLPAPPAVVQSSGSGA